MAAGILVGGSVALLGATNLIGAVNLLVPRSVVRGIQVGVYIYMGHRLYWQKNGHLYTLAWCDYNALLNFRDSVPHKLMGILLAQYEITFRDITWSRLLLTADEMQYEE